IPARGLIPPGLLGPGLRRRSAPAEPSDPEILRGLGLRLVMHPVLRRLFPGFRAALLDGLRGLGIEVEGVDCPIPELADLARSADVDLVAGRWIASYPDPDSFASGLLGAEHGLLSSLCGSEAVFELVEKGRHEADSALRHGLYRQLEELLVAEHRLLPLFHQQTYRFARAGAHGLRLGITVPEVRYEELYLEPLSPEAGGSTGGNQAASFSSSSASE
ncbi:MAG: hypothetical protein MI919_15695, partial [Holophagales bacterium]|nr:hypothetical protein [Holophagales bacterium]